MKKIIFSSFIITIILSLTLVACKDNSNNDESNTYKNDSYVQSDTSNSSVTGHHFGVFQKDYTYSERDQFEKDVTKARAKLDQEINNLEDKSKNATGDTKDWYDKKISELKDKRDNLDSKWKDFQNTTQENWDDFKFSVEDSWNDVENTWNDITTNNKY